MKKSILYLALTGISIAGCQSKPEAQNAAPPQQDTAAQKEEPVAPKTEKSTAMIYPEIRNYLDALLPALDSLPEERQKPLQSLANYINNRRESATEAKLIFICTHNSRRSHLSQIWAATAAAYYGVQDGLHTYSGGTEATAFNPRAVAAIERAGFRVAPALGDNPRYEVAYGDEQGAMTCFSKTYDDESNPQENFAAVMTCSEADENCPFIPGASLRVSLPYVDPKEADGTDREAAAYDERCRQIASEMMYLMSLVKA